MPNQESGLSQLLEWIVLGVHFATNKPHHLQWNLTKLKKLIQRYWWPPLEVQWVTLRENLKFTTRLEHQIPIPTIKQEIYCVMPQYSVAISNNRTIKLVFEKCNRCKLCHEIGNIEAIYSTPSTVKKTIPPGQSSICKYVNSYVINV